MTWGKKSTRKILITKKNYRSALNWILFVQVWHHRQWYKVRFPRCRLAQFPALSWIAIAADPWKLSLSAYLTKNYNKNAVFIHFVITKVNLFYRFNNCGNSIWITINAMAENITPKKQVNRVLQALTICPKMFVCKEFWSV